MAKKIEVLSITEGWVEPISPEWSIWDKYRIKPEPAAPKWPQTTMTSPELTKAYDANKMMICALEDVANAALAHACQAGQLVPADKVREIEAKARAEGAKEAIANRSYYPGTWPNIIIGDSIS